MKKEIERGFEDVFRAREQAQRDAHQEQQAKREREQAFRSSFAAHASAVIRPALEEVRLLLSRQSVEAVIAEDKFQNLEPRIGLYAFTADARLGRPQSPDSASTQLVLTSNAHAGKVSVYEARQSGGQRTAGPAGDIPLEQITADYIQAAVLRLLGEGLGRYSR